MDKQTALQFQPVELGPGEAPGRVCSRCPRCARRFRQGAQFCPYDGDPLQQGSEANADPLIGTVVDGRFEVLSVLGEGGMGIVYRVRHQVLGREFALKVLRAEVAEEEQLGERFLREAQSAASINHPNVCEITDFGELPGHRPYFVMELLAGVPLTNLLAASLPLERVVHLTEQIARALDAAHRAGVVHRDLKPENVIVEATPREERVKVVDFGLAQVVGHSRLTQPGIVFGTPHYMSPEQASGGDVDPRADIYALGVIMYEMLTGRVPFEAETYMGVLSKHLYVEPTPPSKVAPGAAIGALEDVVLKCLKKNRNERHGSMAELLDALNAVVRGELDRAKTLSGASPSAPPSELPSPTPRAPRRSLLGLWLAASAVVVGGIVVLRLSIRTETEAPPLARTGALSAPAVDLMKRALAFGPVDFGSFGGTPPLESASAAATLAPPDQRVRPGPPTPASDPGEGAKRPPRHKKRADFQTSEIIDPWSQ